MKIQIGVCGHAWPISCWLILLHTYLLTINSATLKSVAMSPYDIMRIFAIVAKHLPSDFTEFQRNFSFNFISA